LTGGTIWSPSYQNLVKSGTERGDDEKQPYMIPILQDNKPYVNSNITAVRFSKDAALSAVAFELKDGVGRIMLYRIFDKQGNLRPERDVRKPLRTFDLSECKKMGRVIDIFIFKQVVNDEMQYNMYLLLERGILYYPNIEKRAESVVKMDETTQAGGTYLKVKCADFNY
jgi:hypothetical protein